MLTRSLRPQKFSEVVGNSLNMEILKAIAKNPAETPSTIILEGSYGGGKCVVSGSKVLTSEGYIPIELLHEGGEGQYPYNGDAKVLTSSGWVTPSDTYMKRQEPVKEIKTHSGHSLGGTFHHRIATLTGDLRITYTRLDTLRKHNTVLLYQPVKFDDLPLVLDRYWNLWSPDKSVGEITLVKPTTYSEAYNVVAGAFARCSVEGNPTIVGSYDTLKYLQDLATSVGVVTVFDTRSKLRLGTNAIAPVQRFIKYVLGTVKSWRSAKPIIALTRDQLELVNKEISKLGGVKQTYEVDILYVRDLLTDYYGIGWVREDTILTRVIKLLNWKQTTIESINEYVSDVYDLTVPGVHDFYVEGFISHNTTSARLLAKALNCEDFKDDICGKCKTCNSSLDSVPFYTEYDVTVIGAVDKIRDLRDTFYYTVPNHTRVIVFDEVHTASKAAQSALLKVLEEAPPGVKFVLATTDPEKLLPTIRSRSLELHFTTQTKADVIDNLLESAERLGVSLSEDIADLIATRSKGHMRDAHMLLDQYMLVGEDTFKGVVRSSRMDILKLLVALRTKNKDGYFRAVDGVLTHPLVDIGDDFQSVLLDMVKSGLGEEVDDRVDKVGKLFGPIGALKLVQICSQEWFLKSFQNDVTLQTALLALYQLCNAQSPNKTPQTDRNKKV